MGKLLKAKTDDWVSTSEQTLKTSLRVLAIGAAPFEQDEETVQEVPGTHFIDFQGLTSDFLDNYQPDVVLSPLVTPGFDCVEVAQLLTAGGFNGRYRVFAEDSPRPEMVISEIGRSYPELDFDVLVVTPTRDDHAN